MIREKKNRQREKREKTGRARQIGGERERVNKTESGRLTKVLIDLDPIIPMTLRFTSIIRQNRLLNGKTSCRNTGYIACHSGVFSILM